ncbi:MAG: M28 family peptidase [Candidatus Methylomirabilia bacterium]
MALPQRVLTEQEAISVHLRYLANHLGPRPVGSDALSRARWYIVDTLKRLGFSPEMQAFPTKVPLNAHSQLLTKDGRSIPCRPVIGSLPTLGPLRGIPRHLSTGERPEFEPPFAFALSPLGFGSEGHAVAAAARRGATAALLYREQVPELYSAVIAERAVAVPCVTIRPADALQLAREAVEIELTVEAEPTDVLAENIMVDIGKGGRALLLLAHYDTRPGSPGAYLNASGVAALLELVARLKQWRGRRILVGFLDGEEIGAAGSRHCREVLEAMGLLAGIQGVVYVSGLGLRALSVLPGTRPARSRLVERAGRYAAEEGMQRSPHSLLAAEQSVPTRIWNCPVIGMTGPSLAVQHTALDRPHLLHPRFISRAVSVLERLVQTF